MLPPALAAESFCYLSTTGRVSGRTHTIEIWFGAEGDTLYLLSGGGDRSDWVRNLEAEPAVQVRVGDTLWDATASVVTDPTRRAAAAALVHAKYAPTYGGDLTRWRDTALVIALALGATRPR